MKTIVHSRTAHRAFTLVELVVSLAILGLLALSALAPALAGLKPGGQTAQCLQNTKRLASAWIMYAAENRGNLAQNYQGSLAQGGSFPLQLGPGWAAGWLDWTTSPDNTNVQFLINARYAALGGYMGTSTALFKCPADKQLSAAQRARGWGGRVRSYSLSAGLGGGNAESGTWDSLYRHATKVSDLIFPAPSETLVFIDEDSDSINDPAFFSPSHRFLVDTPAARHNGAGSIAFADGHAECHKWARALNPTADVHWLSFHTQRVSEQSY